MDLPVKLPKIRYLEWGGTKGAKGWVSSIKLWRFGKGGNKHGIVVVVGSINSEGGRQLVGVQS